jgi:hypothetical protein
MIILPMMDLLKKINSIKMQLHFHQEKIKKPWKEKFKHRQKRNQLLLEKKHKLQQKHYLLVVEKEVI